MSKQSDADFQHYVDEDWIGDAMRQDESARKKAEGVVLGRPIGSSRRESLKSFGKDAVLRKLLNIGHSYSSIARILKVHRITVANYANGYVL